MKKNIKKIIALVAIISSFVIGLILMNNRDSIPKSNSGFNFVSLDNAFESYSEIYNEDYQNAINNQVEKLKISYRYDLENPLLIADPYDTVTNGIYVYFETKEKEQVQYIVSCKEYEDFSKLVYRGEDNLSKEHEWLMIGLIPGEKNTITINTLNDKYEIQKSITFSYDCPKAVSEFNVTQNEIEKGDSTQELSNGLYVVLGNQYETGDGEQSQSYISMYDNNGVLRCEIPCVSYKANRLLMDENGLYFSVSGGRICRMDRTGYVNAVYKLGDLLLHHDYIFGTKNDLLVLGSDTSSGTEEDLIFSINLDSKEISTIVDLKNLFPKYFEMIKTPEKSDYLDWMHINSISLIDEDSVIISSRETSTLIKIDNMYTNPTIDYLIGSDHFWEGTGYEDLLLNQDGNFSLQSGQHTITYETDASLEDGEYYLYMYNNNNTVSNTRADYDWAADDNYKNANIGNEKDGAGSFYYKYLVNENSRTFSLIQEIEVNYSGYVSSVQEYKGNIIITSGSKFVGYEYDSDNKLIQKLHIIGDILVYRVFKYDFIGFWFA